MIRLRRCFRVSAALLCVALPIPTQVEAQAVSFVAANTVTPDDFQEGDARDFARLVMKGHVRTALQAAARLPAGVNTAGHNGTKPIELPIIRDDLEMFRALLGAGADPNGTPGRSPLNLAIDLNRPDMVRALLKAGADPNGNWDGEPNLETAAGYARTDMILWLLDAGAHIDQRDEIGGTAIMQAASASSFRTVLLLLDRGASIWATLTNGVTLARTAATSRLLPNNPDGIAKLKVIERLKAMGSPWPPPDPSEVKRLLAEGKWPPSSAK